MFCTLRSYVNIMVFQLFKLSTIWRPKLRILGICLTGNTTLGLCAHAAHPLALDSSHNRPHTRPSCQFDVSAIHQHKVRKII